MKSSEPEVFFSEAFGKKFDYHNTCRSVSSCVDLISYILQNLSTFSKLSLYMLNLLNIDVLHAMNFTPLFFSFMHYLKEILSASIISITLHIAGIQA